jgi:hypothetical protein
MSWEPTPGLGLVLRSLNLRLIFSAALIALQISSSDEIRSKKLYWLKLWS